MAPALGNDGKPMMGADGKPAMEKVVRFKAADDKGDMFVPATALDALAIKHNTRTEKVGNNLVRLGPDGKATPVYESDQFKLNPETGGTFSARTGMPPVGATQAAGGIPGATPIPGLTPPGALPLTRKGEDHAMKGSKFLDDRFNDVVSKVLLPLFGGKMDMMGQISLEEGNPDLFQRAAELTKQAILRGEDGVAAAIAAKKQAEKESDLSAAATGNSKSKSKVDKPKSGVTIPGLGIPGYTGPTPWR